MLLIHDRIIGQSTYTPYSFTRFAGSSASSGEEARFGYPMGMTVDFWGNVFVTDACAIRRIRPNGDVSTVAGRWGTCGSADGTASSARFRDPEGVATDTTGNLYVADTSNHTIRKITPEGVVSTLAGVAGVQGSEDGTGNAARFNAPTAIAVDGSGHIFVADRFNFTVRKVTPTGLVTTLAGLAGEAGSVDGIGNEARFMSPKGMAVDDSGNVYVADTLNCTIRRITPSGVVTTLAGMAGVIGSSDGAGDLARFYYPTGLTMHSSGSIYVADGLNHTIRQITLDGVVSTVAGLAGNEGSTDGPGAEARFKFPAGLAVYSSAEVYVADTYNATIRRISPAGMVTTLAGRAGIIGDADGVGNSVHLDLPNGVATDVSGNVYVASTFDNTIRRIVPGGLAGTLAGSGLSGSADGAGPGAEFNLPHGIALSPSGDAYVADTSNSTIRRITPAGFVTTVAGLAGVPGSADGTGVEAQFDAPRGVAVDLSGQIFVADTLNHTIRRITQSGVVTTLAGLAGVAPGTTDGTGAEARFNHPGGLAIDGSGNIVVADTSNHTIRRITPTGAVTTLAGFAGVAGSTDGLGDEARFHSPAGLAVDGAGNIYVSDALNFSVRRISPAGAVTTIAGLPGAEGIADGTGSEARFSRTSGVAVDVAGNVYVASSSFIHRGIPAFGVNSPVSTGTGRFEFSFDSLPGISYTIEYTRTPTQWAFLQAVTGVGGSVRVYDTNAVEPQRYYRIRTP